MITWNERYIYLNIEMIFLVIHAGYEGSDIAEKDVNFLCNDRYLHFPHEKPKKSFYC